MTVSLREAQPGRHRISLAAVRCSLLLMLLALFAGSASAQSLSPGNPIILGPVNLHQTLTKAFTFSTTAAGADIGGIKVVTEGISNKDFVLASPSNCLGALPFPDQCTVTIAFTPQQIGIRLGALIITNGDGTINTLVNLSGIGVGPQFVFQPATVTATNTAAVVGSFTAGTAVQDPNGNIFFTDVANNRILVVSPAPPPANPVFSVVADVNTPVVSGPALALTSTSGLAFDGVGNLYISSGANVLLLAPGATSLTVLPTPSVTLTQASGLAFDASDDLYIADFSTGKIYRDILGENNNTQALALTGSGAALSKPAGLAIDENNTLYIADSGNSRIVEAPITTLATSVLNFTSITLNDPTGVTVDPAGTLYIADTGNKQIVESTVQGDQFVLTETPDPPLTLTTPAGILIEGNGDMVISDTTLGLITVSRSTPNIIFPTSTLVGSLDAKDDPETLTVQESGNIPSTLVAGTDPDFNGLESTAFPLANSGSCPLTPGQTVSAADTFSIGEICTYNINFDPTIVGNNTANLVLSTTAAGGLTSTSTATLFGIGITTLTHFSLVAINSTATTPTTVNLGGSVELVLTALNSDDTVAKDYSGDITFTTTDANGVYHGGAGAGTNLSVYTMTAADNGILTIPLASGLQLNQFGVWNAIATAAAASLPPGFPNGSGTATSNQIFVVEPSTLILTSSVNPSAVNQSTTFTLTVSTTGGITPTGTVSFYSNGTLIGTGAVTVSGTGAVATASIPDSFSASGSYPITAIYTSTSNTAGGTASLTQVVGVTTATLTSSVNPVAVNATTLLTAAVKSSSGTPTGNVTFKSNGVSIGSAALINGVATLPTSFAVPGVDTLVAVYAGDSNNQPGTTNTVLETVLNVVSISLTSSINPIFLDNPTVLTATLTAVAAGTVPSGTVSFFDGGTPIGTASIVNGIASISASFVYAGAHNLTAVFSGDASDAGSSSSVYIQTVADFSLALATGGSATGSTIAGGTVTYPLVVTPIITSTLPGPVTLTFSGLPASVTGTLTPAILATGSGATPVAFAVTAAPLSLTAHLQRPAHPSKLGYAPIALALLSLPLAWFRRRKRFASLFASLCFLFALTAGLSGCVSTANTGYYGQTPQTYNLTVTATSGNLSRSTFLTLTVQ